MWGVALVLVAVLVVQIRHWFYRWANPKCEGELPPLPIIGESIEFFSPHKLYDIPPFIRKRTTLYGDLFKTSLVEQKVVVSTDPEINYNIFQQENKSFLIGYTENFIEILGQESLLKYHGKVQKYLRNLILQLASPESLRVKLLPEVGQESLLKSIRKPDLVFPNGLRIKIAEKHAAQEN